MPPGMVRPSALAVLRLMIREYFVGRCTGRSAGFALEDSVDVVCGLCVQGEPVVPIGHQTASPGSDRSAHQGQMVASGRGDDHTAVYRDKRLRVSDQTPFGSRAWVVMAFSI